MGSIDPRRKREAVENKCQRQQSAIMENASRVAVSLALPELQVTRRIECAILPRIVSRHPICPTCLTWL